jgi:hypothetical protein
MLRHLVLFPFLIAALIDTSSAQHVKVSWENIERISRSTPTLQVVVNPPLRRSSPIHDRVFHELRRLGADYVRYVPWLPYPKLGVAELEPPTPEKTSWDLTLIDPIAIDFLNATKSHPVVLNFSTIPAWMFKTEKPVRYPEDPNRATWDYTQGNLLRDPSNKELADYYARLVSWYVKGGFVDELGKRHDSGHHFKIDYWEVLNEPDLEHHTTPEQYTKRYDAIVSAIRAVSPDTKFVGISVAYPSKEPDMFEYFLNPKNHAPGIPLDMISYHFYAQPTASERPEIQQYTFFNQADGFLNTVRYVEAIRKRLSPLTRTAINEVGSISADDAMQAKPGHVAQPIPDSYWNLSGATYGYLFGQLASLGIEVIGESQLMGYPTQFPSVSMLDWNSGVPNARYRVLELLKMNFSPGVKLVETQIDDAEIYGLAFIDQDGSRKLLLVNKRDKDVDVTLPQNGTSVQFVDQTTKGNPPGQQALHRDVYKLRGLAVAVISF